MDNDSKNVYEGSQMVLALAEAITTNVATSRVIAAQAMDNTLDASVVLPVRHEDIDAFAEQLAQAVIDHPDLREFITTCARNYIKRLMKPV